MDTVSSLRAALWISLGLSACGTGSSGTDPTDTGTSTTGNQAGLCSKPVELLQETDAGPVPTGYVKCSNRVVHRERAEAAELVSDATGTCTWDYPCLATCEASEGAFCNSIQSDADEDCRCNTTCTTDSDCDDDEACYPNGVHSTCIPAHCKTDDDCDTDMLCELKTGSDVCGNPTYAQACQSVDDECRFDADCSNRSECRFDGDKYACRAMSSSDCGRPFTVEGKGRIATAQVRADWLEASKPLPPHTQAAAWWLRIAQLEHASIASFSRFSLELLSLGAPPALIADVHQAGLDEIRHAQLCFGLASGFGAGAVGPGPLDVRGALSDGLDAPSIARRLVLEACIGETLAALEAAESARRASDPEVRAVLEEIATDEQRHAELGWTCLRWLLASGDAGVRSGVLITFRQALQPAEASAPKGITGLEAYGILEPQRRRDLLEQGRLTVVLPLATALLGESPEAVLSSPNLPA